MVRVLTLYYPKIDEAGTYKKAISERVWHGEGTAWDCFHAPIAGYNSVKLGITVTGAGSVPALVR